MTKVEICNLALAKLSGQLINSIDESSKEARMCKLHWQPCLESCLRSHAWNFATRRVALASDEGDYSGWEYAYAFPADCLAARAIHDPMQKRRVEFQVAVNSALSARVILTNQERAELIYTARVTSTELFDALFVDALVLRLAAELAVAVKGAVDKQSAFMQLYMNALAQARIADCAEGPQKVVTGNSLLEARL